MGSWVEPDRQWLLERTAALGGHGWREPEERERAIDELRAAGLDRLLPYLAELLRDPDVDMRCEACDAAVVIDEARSLDLVMPLLNDPDPVVRWNACGLMHDFGDERAIAPLIDLMTHDTDPQVRGTAAYALGGIGNPVAIPDLIRVMECDGEVDDLGHTPSHTAMTALDDIIGTEHTRLKVTETLRKMAPWPCDPASLKQDALAFYRRSGRGAP